MRVVFMGTSSFAVPVLETLAENYDVVLVVTQPDRPSGRGRAVHEPPVKQTAQRLGIPVFQPEKIREESAIQRIAGLQPIDVIVVAAFGQIIPKAILDMPRLGCVNIHGSLLPKFRGAAPIQHAIMAGEKVTGVTTMLMDEGLDTGDILMKREIPIGPEDNAGDLMEKLARLGAEMVVPTLEGLDKGTIKPEKQDDSQATIARSLKREAGLLELNRSAQELDRLIRGVTPEPGAYIETKSGILKVWKAAPVQCPQQSASPGTIISVGKDGVIVAVGSGCLELKEVQPESRKRMNAAEYARGARLKPGDSIIG